MIAICILAIIGFCISLYAYFTESKIKEDPNYHPACDINDRISCSAPLKSEYSNIFYFSNALMGIAYYILVGVLAYFGLHRLLLVATAGGAFMSLILAYLLYFKIKSLCIVCTSLYIVNILLLLFALRIL
jgi:vitamin-K-epoxide reductase (warfarin-sensitive)